jgi:hypothetical protein
VATLPIAPAEPNVPLERPADIAPGVALTTPWPQVVAGFGTAATTKPAGKGSVTTRLVKTPAFAGRVIVMVNRVVPPPPTAAGAKALVAVTPVVTVKVAVAGAVLLPIEVTKSPTGIVLVLVAIGAAVPTITGTEMVQAPVVVSDGAMGIDPPVIEKLVAPGVAVTIPPQVVVADGEGATVKPAPMVVNWSEILVMAAALAVLALTSVKVNMLVPLRGKLVGLKALLTPTARMTSVALVDEYGTPESEPARIVLP